MFFGLTVTLVTKDVTGADSLEELGDGIERE